jgi:hypothetical protein
MKIPYHPPDHKLLYNLPLNRYPFLGSHDAATFVQENTNRPWLIVMLGYLNKWAYTQTIDFQKQYQEGVRFFDFRFQYFNKDPGVIFRHGDGKVAGMDLGIVFYQPSHPKYISLDKMLDQCISEQECIIINIKKEVGDKPLYDGESLTETLDPTRSIFSNFANYLSHSQTNKNYLPYVHWIQSGEDMRRSVNWYRQQNKYILISRSEFVHENWDVSVVCQSQPVVSFFYTDACNDDSCANPNSRVWSDGLPGTLITSRTTGFFKYIDRIYQEYIQQNSSELNVTQAMFQSYSSNPNLKNGIPISFQDCTKGEITKLENIAHVSYRMYEYMMNHQEYVTNVLLMDNIGAELSPYTQNGEAISWSKMAWFQLINNIMARKNSGDPFYAS